MANAYNSFKQYLIESNTIGHHLVATATEIPDGVGFYIHPDGVDGETPNFTVEDNVLVPSSFRDCNHLSFSVALALLKEGNAVRRTGWNGKGMFVVYQKGYPQGIPCNRQTARAWGLQEGDNFICNPYLQIQQVDGSHSMWVPSIGDILGEDWEVVYNEEGD